MNIVVFIGCLVGSEGSRDVHNKRVSYHDDHFYLRPKAVFDETKLYQPSDATDPNNLAVFSNFEGLWELTTSDDWQIATAVYFYVDENDKFTPDPDNPKVVYKALFKAKFYHGLPSQIREIVGGDKVADPASINIPTVSSSGEVADTCTVEILGPRAIRFYNYRPVLSSDTKASTFTIQSADPNTAYAYLWSDWDGTSDDSRVGYVETLMQYKRVNDCLPPITPASGPQEKNYYNPLNLFDYVRRYYLEAGQPQKVYGTNTWIGSTTAYNALANQIVSQGVTRTIGGYPASKQPRGGKNIGVLKTRQSNKYPFTTIFTNGPHRFNSGSKITISGFTAGSPYAVLNGTFLAAAFPAFPMVKLPGASWVKEGSSEYYVNILYDSSKILVDYNPLLHGVPTLTATHGPLTAESEYRETIAAILDFIITAYDGSNHTHTRIRPYRYNDKLALFETWGELKAALTVSKAVRFTIRLRNYQSNNYKAYWNPYVLVGDSPSLAPFMINDPFDLYTDYLTGSFNYDVVKENYLESAFNMFATVTGPMKADEPITSLLTSFGYPSNGSQVKYTVAPFGAKPADLVDSYGKHPYWLFGSVNNGAADREFAKYSYFGGMIKKELTGNERVAYIRIGSEDAFDGPIYQLTVRPLVFAPNTLSAKAGFGWIGSYAALIEKLESLGATKYIIDSRNNGGGFAQAATAIASLFGRNRTYGKKSIAVIGSDTETVILDAANIQTYGNALLGDTGSVASDDSQLAYPNGVVRNKNVVFLNSDNAASGGDELPHYFLGSNIILDTLAPPPAGWDIDGGVKVKFVGNTDARLSSGVKLYDNVPPVGSPLTLACEAGLLAEDRYGPLAYSQPWMAPQVLLPGWFDDTVWSDLGLIAPKNLYPLGNLKPNPVYKTKSTYRDLWLEHSIKTTF